MKKTFAGHLAAINKVTFYHDLLLFCFAEGKRALWCQIFTRIFQPMMLHVTDVSVIPDRKHNRDYERTIQIYKLCNFPHIQFR